MSSILNRRNAMLGWAVWTVVRHQAKRRAKRALHVDSEPRRGRAVALVLGVLTAAGLFVAWRKLRGGDDAEWPASPPLETPRPETSEPTPLRTSVQDDDIPPAA